MRAVLYARKSSRDQKSIPMQFADLRDYAERRGWRVVAEVEETESGKNDARPRRAELLKKLCTAKRAGDVVLAWKLDRWGRSAIDLMLTLKELHTWGVAFVSVTEGFDLTTPAGRMQAGIFAVIAEFERELIVERVNAGIKRYRERNNDRWGRPSKARDQAETIKRLFGEGKSRAAIARELEISRASVMRALEG